MTPVRTIRCSELEKLVGRVDEGARFQDAHAVLVPADHPLEPVEVLEQPKSMDILIDPHRTRSEKRCGALKPILLA